MNGTLVIAEHEGGALSEVTAELVGAAAALDGPVTLGIPGADPDGIGGTDLEGVERILGVRVPDEAGHEVRQRAVEVLMEMASPRAVVLASNWDSAAFAAGLAEQAGAAFATDVVGLARADDGSLLATRPAYGGKVDVTLRLAADRTAILLLRPGAWPPAPSGGRSAPLEIADVEVDGDSRVRRVELLEPETGDADLTRAEVIFGLGRGVGKAEHIAVFEEVAKKLGVVLGASRPLVDVGLLPRDRQIGQSGVTVKPRLYVAFGISGSMQHMAGIGDSRVLFAINTDEEAPIFDAAHLGSTVDAMEVARCLLDGQ